MRPEPPVIHLTDAQATVARSATSVRQRLTNKIIEQKDWPTQCHQDNWKPNADIFHVSILVERWQKQIGSDAMYAVDRTDDTAEMVNQLEEMWDEIAPDSIEEIVHQVLHLVDTMRAFVKDENTLVSVENGEDPTQLRLVWTI
jgi:hypothetical protein